MVTYNIYEVKNKDGETMNKNKTLRLIVGGAIIWGLFGFVMTSGSFLYQYPSNLSPDELGMQIDTFDKLILVKSIIIFIFGGMAFMFILADFYHKSPPRVAARNSFFFAIIMGIAYSLFFALWYFPIQDITGTNAILRPMVDRIFFNSLIGFLGAVVSYGFFMRIPFFSHPYQRSCAICKEPIAPLYFPNNCYENTLLYGRGFENVYVCKSCGSL